MKRILVLSVIVLLSSCSLMLRVDSKTNSQYAREELAAAASANPSLGYPVGPSMNAQALLAVHEQGMVLWLDKPSTTFWQLKPSGFARRYPDAVLEGPEVWEDVDAMRGAFPHCIEPLLPPTGGTAKMWIADRDSWSHLGCVKSSTWNAVTVQMYQNGIIVGPFQKGVGRNDRFFVVIDASVWHNHDVGEQAASAIGKIPGILMGEQASKGVAQ